VRDGHCGAAALVARRLLSRSTGGAITSFKQPVQVFGGPYYLPFVDFASRRSTRGATCS
jgi:hypothetical protein